MAEVGQPSDSHRYHHGDLANVLRGAAADLLAERGVAGFSLREVARRADVSHAAPAHHFGDAQGLLTAVAIEGFEYLTFETEAAIVDVSDPAEALARLGRAYVTVSIDHPGHCAVMFRKDTLDDHDHDHDHGYQVSGRRAYGVLLGAVERFARERSPQLDTELAAALCWSSVQGLITVHGPLRALAETEGRSVPSIGDLAERFTHLLVSGFEALDS